MANKVKLQEKTGNDAGVAPSMALSDRLTFLVHVASARIAAIGNRHFRQHDLNHFSARILVLLLDKKSLRTGELVELMALPQSTISSQLQGLHKKRLIRRRRSPIDSRSVIVTLTTGGLRLAAYCNDLSLGVHAAMLSNIPLSEQGPAFAFLRKINARLLVLETQSFHLFEQEDKSLNSKKVGAASSKRLEAALQSL